MAATVRSFSATPSSGGVSSLAAPKPTGTVAGDVLYAYQFADSSTLAQMTASGWLELAANSSSPGVFMKLWRKVAGESEPTDYTFNCGGGADTLVIIRCVMDADTTSPEDGSPATATGSASSQSAPAVTPTQSNSLLLCAVASSRSTGAASSYTPPSGMTEEGDVQCSVPFGGFMFGSGASLQLVASGSTGTKTFTATSSEAFVAGSIAVRSAGGAGTTVTPATFATSAAFPAATTDTPGNVTATPATIATAASFPTTTQAISVAATPATIAATTAFAAWAVDVGAGPDTIPVVAAFPAASTSVPSSPTVTPATITATAAFPLVSLDGDAVVSPAALATAAAFPAATVHANSTVTPATITVTAAFPQASVSGGGVVLEVAIYTGTVTGPARFVESYSGPATARDVDGPDLARTVTGPGAQT